MRYQDRLRNMSSEKERQIEVSQTSPQMNDGDSDVSVLHAECKALNSDPYDIEVRSAPCPSLARYMQQGESTADRTGSEEDRGSHQDGGSASEYGPCYGVFCKL